MDFKHLTLSLATFALTATTAQAATTFQPLLTGVDSSGGGNAVVCRAKDGKIKSAELLDLFEARILYRRTVVYSKDHRDLQATRNVQPLYDANDLGFMSLTSNLETVLRIAHVLPNGVALQPINDTFSPVLPKNCKIEQLAAYQINNELYIDGEIWAHLDMTNQAALYAHEAIYKTLRDYGATNSIRARKLVGLLFSDTVNLKPVLTPDVPNDQRSYCGAGGGAGGFLSRGMMHARYVGDKAELTFVALAGQPVASRKSLTIDADFIRNPNPLRSISFIENPSAPREFEDGDRFSLTAYPDRLIVYVKSEFGDESLNDRYEFIGCEPFEK